MLIILGIIMIALGFVLLFADRIPLIGRLPGDITIRGKNYVFYLPLATMLLISVIISLILWLLSRR